MKVIAFAREAGGAAAIAPVCRDMQRNGWDLLLLAKDNGLGVFGSEGLDYLEFKDFDTDRLADLVERRFASIPDLIFTSATSLPALDMTEKYLWQWGRERGIETAALLDQWQNYALRFSGCGKDERLAYLPDHIFVMDELARDEMIKEGIPCELIIITGQPAFGRFFEEHEMLISQVGRLKSRLNIPEKSTVITFAAESLKKDFGGSLGYDEQSIVTFLGDALNDIAEQNKDLNIYLIVKLHPENRREEFDFVLSRWPRLTKVVIGKKLTPYEAIEISDMVIGMSSILLVGSIIADKITLSLEIGSAGSSQSAAARRGAMPFIQTTNAGKDILARLLQDEKYREGHLTAQRRWRIERGGAAKCMETLKAIKCSVMR